MLIKKTMLKKFPHLPVTEPDIPLKKNSSTPACSFIQQIICLLWAKNCVSAGDEQ